jgi:branched-chain amino acid aminotransferase
MEAVSVRENTGFTVYEVFRVIGGIPLFLEDHYARLALSMQLQQLDNPLSYDDFLKKTLELIRINGKSDGNIRFAIVGEGAESSWYFAFLPATYPDVDDWVKGVDTELFVAEREKPNAKVLQKNVRFTANRLIDEHHVYEVLLVDHDGFITEGSRSNVFFVKGEVFYTAPASKVLVGITRRKVFVCLNELGFQIVEEAVHHSELKSFDAVFLTGTSPKVLPVRSIGEITFRVGHSAVGALMRRYDEIIAEYIKSRKPN